MSVEMLEIVDENDVVIGTAPRKEIHQKGLLHREINVLFVTPKADFIFQRRSKTKDTFPDMLVPTVGGHVEIGDSYEETAVKEILEETGLKVQKDKLVFIEKIRFDAEDPVTQTRNNVHRVMYGYIFNGKKADLKVEEGDGAGFEIFSGDNIFNLPDDTKQKFFSLFVDPDRIKPFYQKLLALVEKS